MAYEVEILSSLNPVPDDLNVSSINVRSLSASTITGQEAFFRSITSLSAVTQINSSTSGDLTVNGNLYVLQNAILTGSLSSLALTSSSAFFDRISINTRITTDRLNLSGTQSTTGRIELVGNNADSSPLNIKGSGFSLVQLQNTDVARYSTFQMLNESGTEQGGFGSANASASLSSLAGKVYIYTKNKDLNLITNYNNPGQGIFVKGTDGFVGIGTMSPTTNLHVTGGLSAQHITAGGTATFSYLAVGTNTPRSIAHIQTSSADGEVLRLSKLSSYTADYGPALTFWNANNEELAKIKGLFTSNSNGNYADLALYSRASDVLGTVERLRIKNTGFVGIGTNIPLAHLHVTGSISAQSITALNTISAGVISAGYSNFSTVNASNGIFNNLSANNLTYSSITSIEIVTTGSLNVQGSLDVTANSTNTFITRFVNSNSADRFIIGNPSGDISATGTLTITGNDHNILGNTISIMSSTSIQMYSPDGFGNGVYFTEGGYDPVYSGIYGRSGDQILVDYVSSAGVNQVRMGHGYIISRDDGLVGITVPLTAQSITAIGTISAGTISGNDTKITKLHVVGSISAQSITALGSISAGSFSSNKIRIQNSNTIAGSNLENSSILVGSISTGIGIDNNEIYKNGGELYVGTIDNSPIILNVNAINRLIVSNTGVGIGTNAPLANLHVTGSISAQSITALGSISAGTFSAGRVNLANLTVRNIYDPENNRNMILSSGYVGIYSTPTISARLTNSLYTLFQTGEAKLQVFSGNLTVSSLNTLLISRINQPTNDSEHGILFTDTNSIGPAIRSRRQNLSSNYKNDLVFYTGDNNTDWTDYNNARLIIKHDGKTGLGTQSPNAHLHVTGSISAQSLTSSYVNSNSAINIGNLYPASITALDGTSFEFLSINGDTTNDSGVFLRRSDNLVGFDLWNDHSRGVAYLDNRWSGASRSFIFRTNTASASPEILFMIASSGITTNLSISSSSMSAGSASFNDININNSLYANEIAAAVKHFVIPHPLKKGNVLVHGSLEGPENGVFYRGISQLKDGISIIKLPEYFNKLVHEESITIYLQTINEHEDIYLKEINYKNNEFTVVYRKKKFIEKLIMGKNKDVRFSWLVIAERKDTPKLRIEK